jgi:hypothetical protein
MANKRVTYTEHSAYDKGITKANLAQKYTLNGENNNNFKKYRDSYDDSPTNAFIIKTIVNYIVGNGLIDKSGSLNPHDYISKGDLRMICLDFKRDGSAFPQVINLAGKPIKIKHTPTVRVGLQIDINKNSSDYMDVTGYWYSFDYTEKTKFVPSFVPKFSRHTNENAIEIIHIKTLSSEPFFPFPDWFSGFKSAQIESALIDDAVNHITRGFQGKTIINVNNAGMVLEDEVEQIKTKVKEDYIGTKNGDGVIISLNDGPQDAIIIDTIEPRGRNEQFVTYDETAEFKLMAAHQAMNILFSRPGSSGFSSNADEIAMATDSLYLGTINPLREILLDDFNLIFKKINPNCDIDFVNFGQEKVIVSKTSVENE